MKATSFQDPRQGPARPEPVILQAGFRLFFLLAPAYAVIALAMALLVFSGIFDPPLALAPSTWHAHEMLFGFVTAAVAGFLLTAIPNWTAIEPVKGPALALLGAAWLLGRLAITLGDGLSAWFLVPMDLLFPLMLLFHTSRPIFIAKNRRNFVVPALVALLALATGLTHWQDGSLGLTLGIFTVIFLISLIGGRVVPAFTGNWLRRQGLEEMPRPFGVIDRLGILATAIAALLTLAPVADHWGGGVLVVAGLLHLVRWSGWRFWRTLADPLVWSLHAGYLWLAIGLICWGVARLGTILPENAALHALTTGAFGTMILAIMPRASLGHSGRPLEAPRLTTLAFVLIGLGASCRVASVWWPSLLHPAGLFWSGAFVLFLIDFWPILTQPRISPP